MIVGSPKETKDNEFRIGLIPSGVEQICAAGHTVLIEAGAGHGSGFQDEEYSAAGAEIVDTAEEVFSRSETIVKVKEPIEPEYDLIREGQVVFTYFHFAASERLTRAMIDRGAVAIAYETMRAADGSLPLLTPMSEIAGRMAIQIGMHFLEKPHGGQGILLSGVPGVAPGRVVILGGGVVGSNAALIAAGLGARVLVLDINLDRLRYLGEILPPNVWTLAANPRNIRDQVAQADLLVGAVLIAGAKAPTLVTREMVRTMKDGAVVLDVAVDQGGCVETARPTSHSDPVYVEEGVLHYCVANMPGAVGRTSTYALTNATTPYVLAIAAEGWEAAARRDPVIAGGVNLCHGEVTHPAVAGTFGLPYRPLDEIL